MEECSTLPEGIVLTGECEQPIGSPLLEQMYIFSFWLRHNDVQGLLWRTRAAGVFCWDSGFTRAGGAIAGRPSNHCRYFIPRCLFQSRHRDTVRYVAFLLQWHQQGFSLSKVWLTSYRWHQGKPRRTVQFLSDPGVPGPLYGFESLKLSD